MGISRLAKALEYYDSLTAERDGDSARTDRIVEDIEQQIRTRAELSPSKQERLEASEYWVSLVYKAADMLAMRPEEITPWWAWILARLGVRRNFELTILDRKSQEDREFAE